MNTRKINKVLLWLNIIFGFMNVTALLGGMGNSIIVFALVCNLVAIWVLKDAC